MLRLNLVDESHKALKELSAIRNDFKTGKINESQAKNYVALFNATSRSIGISITAEKWYKEKVKKIPCAKKGD